MFNCPIHSFSEIIIQVTFAKQNEFHPQLLVHHITDISYHLIVCL